MDGVNINGRIVLLRQRLNLSQKSFAERIGRSATHLNRVENGKVHPSSELLEKISATFGVSISWLKTGAGPLVVESVGDRFRQARKARDYTQEELAGELHISRNSVGMIERGTFRPSPEIIDQLCEKLWIDKNWLLTGQGHMERTELTGFYTILRQNPEVRRHIKSFIEHLDRGPRYEAQEDEEEPVEDRWVTAYVVNDVLTARLFCEKYNIAYKVEQRGKEQRSEIKVLGSRDIDRERAHVVEARLRKIGLRHMCDHEFIWRDRDGNTIITYSPYDVESVKQSWIEKVEENFYGHGTTTFVVRG